MTGIPAIDRALNAAGAFGDGDATLALCVGEIRKAMAARDVLEAMQVDLVLVALGMFRRALAAAQEAAVGDPKIHRAVGQAQRFLMQSLKEWRTLAARDLAAPEPTPEPAPEPAPELALEPAPEPAETPAPSPVVEVSEPPAPIAPTAPVKFGQPGSIRQVMPIEMPYVGAPVGRYLPGANGRGPS